MNRVLVADDSAPVRSALSAMFGVAEGIVVVGVAVDGREAIRQARALEPDVVVMDMRMPNLDGLDASREILRERPATRILMLSAYTDPSIERAAAAIGVEAFLRKGAPASELIAAISSGPVLARLA